MVASPSAPAAFTLPPGVQPGEGVVCADCFNALVNVVGITQRAEGPRLMTLGLVCECCNALGREPAAMAAHVIRDATAWAIERAYAEGADLHTVIGRLGVSTKAAPSKASRADLAIVAPIAAQLYVNELDAGNVPADPATAIAGCARAAWRIFEACEKELG